MVTTINVWIKKLSKRFSLTFFIIYIDFQKRLQMTTLQSEIFSFTIIAFVVILLAFFTQKLQNKEPKE